MSSQSGGLPCRTLIQQACRSGQYGLEEETDELYDSECDLDDVSEAGDDYQPDAVDEDDIDYDNIPPVSQRKTRVFRKVTPTQAVPTKIRRLSEKSVNSPQNLSQVDPAPSASPLARDPGPVGKENAKPLLPGDFISTTDKHGVQFIYCPQCGRKRKYRSEVGAQKHISQCHSGKVAPFNCSTCDAPFFFRSDLTSHENRRSCHRIWVKDPPRPRLAPRRKPPYKAGPTKNFSKSNPVKIFLWLLRNVLPIWITNTERDGKVRYQYRTKEPWKTFNLPQACRWLGLFLSRGLLHLHRLRDGHSKKGLFRNEFFKNTMPCYREMQILTATRFVDLARETAPGERGDKDSPTFDRLWRVADIIDAFISQCQKAFHPGLQLSIDEMMTKFTGVFRWKSNIPTKPIKDGIKAFVLCDSKTGYILNFIPSVCKSFATYGDLGATGASVWALLSGETLRAGRNFLDLGHYLFTDQFYTMFRLIERLYESFTYYCGTINKCRQIPPEILDPNHWDGTEMKRGDAKHLHCGFMTLTYWKDNGFVLLANSIPDVVDDVSEVVRQVEDENNPGYCTGKTFDCPKSIKMYNKWMGAVDLADQYLSYMNVHIRQRRWYMSIWLRIVEMAMLNAFILYKESHKDSPLSRSRKAFHVKVIHGLIEFANELEHKKNPHKAPEPRVINGKTVPVDLRRESNRFLVNDKRYKYNRRLRHWPVRLSSRRKCIVHLGKASNRKIATGCSDCKVALCIGDCYREWHTDE